MARGYFATLTPKEREEIGRKGGQNSQRKGTAHRWTADEARAHGQRGGRTRWNKATTKDTQPATTQETADETSRT